MDHPNCPLCLALSGGTMSGNLIAPDVTASTLLKASNHSVVTAGDSFQFGGGATFCASSVPLLAPTVSATTTLKASSHAVVNAGDSFQFGQSASFCASNAPVHTSSTTIQVSTVTNSNVVNVSEDPNTSFTTASGNNSMPYGAYKEVIFDTFDFNGAVSPNLTASFTPAVNSVQFMSVQQSAATANGDNLTWTSPGFVLPGSYVIEYQIACGNARPIVDLAIKTADDVAFRNLRTGLDLYTTPNDGIPLTMKEFFTVLTENTLLLKWTVNGQNPASTGYFLQVGNLRVWSA